MKACARIGAPRRPADASPWSVERGTAATAPRAGRKQSAKAPRARSGPESTAGGRGGRCTPAHHPGRSWSHGSAAASHLGRRHSRNTADRSDTEITQLADDSRIRCVAPSRRVVLLDRPRGCWERPATAQRRCQRSCSGGRTASACTRHARRARGGAARSRAGDHAGLAHRVAGDRRCVRPDDGRTTTSTARASTRPPRSSPSSCCGSRTPMASPSRLARRPGDAGIPAARHIGWRDYRARAPGLRAWMLTLPQPAALARGVPGAPLASPTSRSPHSHALPRWRQLPPPPRPIHLPNHGRPRRRRLPPSALPWSVSEVEAGVVVTPG
jgi:hypothetical protein